MDYVFYMDYRLCSTVFGRIYALSVGFKMKPRRHGLGHAVLL